MPAIMPAAPRRRASAGRTAYSRPVNDGLTLVLLITGLLLFVAGDIMWFARHMMDRPMEIRVTGSLVGAGVLLIGLGMLRLVFGG